MHHSTACFSGGKTAQVVAQMASIKQEGRGREGFKLVPFKEAGNPFSQICSPFRSAIVLCEVG